MAVQDGIGGLHGGEGRAILDRWIFFATCSLGDIVAGQQRLFIVTQSERAL